MKYKSTIECEDTYEAEKLAAFFVNQKDESTLIKTAKNWENELVITLGDKSSHCIVLSNELSAVKLKTIIHQILDGKAKLLESRVEGSLLHIEYFLR
jgi:hypothetical protein